MASISASKGRRKVKGKTFDLTTFLGEDNEAPSGFSLVNARRIDWADAMENEELDDRFTLDFKRDEKVILPTAPKSARGLDIDLNRVPFKPPFTAYLGNLPYDATEDDIVHFFRHLQVSNVRLPLEGGDRGRSRGFGYAEFKNRQTLIESLSLNNETLKNRPIKVSLAGESDNDRERRDDRSDRLATDWRSGRRDPPASSSSSRNDSFHRSDGFTQQRSGPSNYTDRYRSPRNNRPQNDIGDSYNSMNDRHESHYRRPDMNPYENNYEKRRSPDYTQSADRWSHNQINDLQQTGVTKERQKLQLKPRTKPVDSSAVEIPVNSAIFGGARPVDTAAREREIEERLAKERDESAYTDQKDRPIRVRTSSRFSNRSRKSSDSIYGSHPNSFSEDDCMPQPKSILLQQQYFSEPHHPTTLPRIKPRPNPVQLTDDHSLSNDTKSVLATQPTRSTSECFGTSLMFRNHEVPAKKILQRQPSEQETEKPNDIVKDDNFKVVNQQTHGSSPKHTVQEDTEPPVYTSVNKFSHLPNDADDFHEVVQNDATDL